MERTTNPRSLPSLLLPPGNDFVTNPRIPQHLRAVALDRIMYLNQPQVDQQFHYIVVLDGRLDESRLRRAIRLTMDAEPVFGCRYMGGRWPHWERRDDLDSLPLCKVVESFAGIDALTEYMARPCDAASDPLLEACVVRGTSDIVCLKINHAACDGAGGN